MIHLLTNAALALHDKGIETVMITLGAKGVWLSHSGEGNQGELIPGFRVEATDTTAAGDTFNGAFVTGLLEEMPLEKAIKLRTCCSGYFSDTFWCLRHQYRHVKKQMHF